MSNFMNKNEFAKFLSDNFECSKPAADGIITLFSEGVYLALSEGQNIDIDSLGEFKATTIPAKKAYSMKSGKIIKYPTKQYLSFKPAKDLKIACGG